MNSPRAQGSFYLSAFNNNTNMTASQQPISASTSSYVKTKDDRLQSIQAVGGPTVEVAKVEDAFLYYSNDQVRMKELLLQDVEDDSSDDEPSSTSVSNQEQSTTSCVRKTRITFELHPSLLLEDLMNDDELFGDDTDFDDKLDELLLAKQDSDAEDDVINALRRIMLA
ncbi:hypothetical protein QTG54_005116 [Skeletonema marinoi]|uniref:Uncharacterized protein n=1 Tax=Skeletonema marinoi TaxID=267567 RepID=A0AAD9DGB6_9STRA|nr:hypothetical protein QTG54_005116 [Skeletonema marinoi]